MGEQQRKPGAGFWTASVLTLLLLYVLSSGPMTMAAFQRTNRGSMHGGKIYPDTNHGKWWPKLYAPLVWASQESWGGILKKYWKLFPVIRGADPRR